MTLNLKKVFKNKYVVIAMILCVAALTFIFVKVFSKADGNAGITYRAHVAYNGWLDWAADGAMAGRTGESRRMEGIKIKLTGDVAGDVIYQSYVRDIGWQNEVMNSETSGVVGESKQIEAIKIRLSGDVAQSYDVQYRVHLKNIGWQDWVSNGAVAGSETYKYRIEAIEIKLVEKSSQNQDAPVQQPEQDAPVQQPEQPAPEPEQPAPEQETGAQESPFHKYTDLTETQLKKIARLCQQEQGTARGAAAEASLMANHMDLRFNRAKNYENNGTGLYTYVREGGWFAQAPKHMDKADPSAEILEAVRKVLVEGKRTLPGYVNEHDCFSDISSATNDGASINKKDRGSYVQHKTYIKNAYDGNYTFYCFPSDTSDPFGYTSTAKREEIGDFCYNFDDI